jgi:hypothetical protein
MTTPIPFALDLPPSDSMGQWLLRILAVVGGAAIGGLTIGLITQGLSRLLTTRPVPRVPLQIVRLLGAIVCGWIVAIFMFGGGLGGLGGGGGWGLSGGGGPGGSGKEQPPVTARSAGTGRDSGKAGPGGGLMLQVEVLPEYPAVYRVHTPGGPRTYKFEELTAYLLEQKKATPPVTGIEVSEESSDPNAPAVLRLTEWARKNGLSAVTPPRPSP